MVAACGMFACALDESGTLADAGTDVFFEAGDACGACGTAITQGWQPALFGDASCPSGFAQQSVVVAAEAGAGACGCTCSLEAGSCTSGTAPLKYGSAGVCPNNTGFAVTGTCQSLGTTESLGGSYAIQPPPISPCTPNVAKNDASVSVANGTLCRSPTSCDVNICASNAPPGWLACLSQPGDVACPSGPFSQRTVIGSTANLVCGACSCTGTPSCSGSLTYYADLGCTIASFTIPGDGSCVSPDGAVASAYEWNGSVVGACTPSTPTASVDLGAQTTVCCAP